MAGFLDEIAPVVADACNSGSLGAAGLAVIHDGRSYEFAWGQANRLEGIEATPGTLFHIGSVTKSLTAELVWKLIAAERLSADMPVIAAAPELSHIAALADTRLTIGHLLSHTGGIDGDVIFDAGRGRDVLRRYMSQIRQIGSLFAPGEQFSYANVGYGILGRIVELAGGAAFEDVLARSLRGEHKLSKIAILPIEKIVQRTALHHVGGQPDYFGPYSNIASGTVLAMSMGDLARWGAAHLAANGRVPEWTERMRRAVVPLPHNHRYEAWGSGFTLLDGEGETLFGHDGGTAGTGTFLRIAPHHGTVWAFSATGNGSVSVYRKIEPALRRLAGLPAPPQRIPSGGPVPKDLGVYEGVYTRHGMEFTVTRAPDATFVLTIDGDMAPKSFSGLTLRPLTAQVCEMRIPSLDASVWVSFHEFDGNGKPQLLFLLERMARRTP
ncbi:MAG TPA: serine hydrolase domain-containing protein [Rhizomicrobium sp.]